MKPVKETLCQTIPQLFALCDTIREAAAHGAADSEAAKTMKEDIVAGIQAVESAAQDFVVAEATFAPTEYDTLTDLTETELQEFVEHWFSDSIGPFLLKRFQQLLDQSWSLEQEDAQGLAHWILQDMPALPITKKSLLLAVGWHCSLKAPEFSWNLMMEVFDSMTPVEQKQRFPYWTGAPYCAGQHPQTEFKCCPVCGGQGVPYQSAISGRMNDFDTLFLPAKLWMRCQDCGNLYTRYFPSEFLKLGAATKLLQPDPNSVLTQKVEGLPLPIWSSILNKIRTYTNGRTLLEVGVGEGHLVAVAQEMGYEVTAVEVSTDQAQKIANLLQLPVINGDFLNLPEDRQVDIITMGDVLEHLQRPLDGLKKAAALLKDGGVLWLSTPNFESSFTRMMKMLDPMWCEPYHITYFSRAGLLPLLEQVGFELLEYSVSNRYNGSMELLLRKKVTVQ